jgi:hypothetical protein
LMRL